MTATHNPQGTRTSWVDDSIQYVQEDGERVELHEAFVAALDPKTNDLLEAVRYNVSTDAKLVTDGGHYLGVLAELKDWNRWILVDQMADYQVVFIDRNGVCGRYTIETTAETDQAAFDQLERLLDWIH